MAGASVIVTCLKSFPGLRSASVGSPGDVRERQLLIFKNVETEYSGDAVRNGVREYFCSLVGHWGCGAVQDDEFPKTQGNDILVHKIAESCIYEKRILDRLKFKIL